ncbi:hypothetical protein J2T13_002421 [Paenibacillus sp. DS2015]|uniref:hypothetical protein n=1 Tax=Paenibacillus sp. DS2015 TaxID=3373917 RepID=UPI003D25FE8D
MGKSTELQSMTTLQYLALIHQVSYTNVCREVGLTPQQFNDWVKKRRPVPQERIQGIADYFKVDANRLIDDNHYLLDLTSETKVDLQIIFLNQLLEEEGENADTEAYSEKLAALQLEKKKQALITRFTTIMNQKDEQKHRISEAFLNHIEQGNLKILEQLLEEQELGS